MGALSGAEGLCGELLGRDWVNEVKAIYVSRLNAAEEILFYY